MQKQLEPEIEFHTGHHLESPKIRANLRVHCGMYNGRGYFENIIGIAC